MRKAVIVAFVIVGLWSVSQLLVVIFTCSPIEKFWNSDLPGTCIPNLPFWYINAAGNIVTDIIVFLLPLPSLTRLNLRKGQKLGLIGVFSLGFFVRTNRPGHKVSEVFANQFYSDLRHFRHSHPISEAQY